MSDRSGAKRWSVITLAVLALSVLSPTAHAGVGTPGTVPDATSPNTHAAPRTASTHLSASTAAAPTAAGAFRSLTPSRLLDTRTGTGAPRGAIRGNTTTTVQVTGRAGVPATNVSAVAVTITATDPVTTGYLTGYASGAPRPGASNLNFTTGQTIANLAIVPVGADGRITLYNGSPGTVQLIADVAGYYLSGTPTAAGAFRSLTPSRLLDTRTGTGAPRGAIRGNTTTTVQVTGRAGVPTTNVSAVAVTITATDPVTTGYLTGYASGAPRPGASNLNFTTGQTIANLAIVPVGADGRITLYNGSPGTVQLIADVAGYYLDTAIVPDMTWTPSTFATQYLTSVSCTAEFCGATGAFDGYTYSDGAWSAATPFSGGADDGDYVYSVSCTGPTFCVAVSSSAKYSVYDGTSWSTYARNTLNAGRLAYVSCVSTTYCVGLDTGGHTATFDGTTWSDAVILGDGSYVPYAPLSCTTQHFCQTIQGNDGIVLTFANGTWSGPRTVGSSDDLLVAVSCVSTSFCLAVSTHGSSFRYSSGVWSPGPDLRADDIRLLSCASTTYCVATDSAGEAIPFDGTTWGAPRTIDVDYRIESVSCSTNDFCVAVDLGGRSIIGRR